MSFRPRSAVASGRPDRVSRTILLCGLLLTAILWCAMWLTHSAPTAGPHLSAAASPSLGTASAATMLWMVMMAAMMTPAALPWLSVLAAMPRVRAAPAGATARGGVHAGAGGPDEPYLRAGSLLLGYLTIWGLFSVLAAASQLLLLQLALLEPHTLRLTGRAAGGVLLLAGLWELSPIKDACLRRCRSPFGVLLADWRPGAAHGYRIGLRHGLTCLGCCWGLMALAFVVGVVNLAWMAVLTAVVCAEKVMPRGHLLPRLLGVALAGIGVALLASPG